ncbi:FMN-dependent NADH-azoreductase [Bradyrhizobium sp. AZCC 1693]
MDDLFAAEIVVIGAPMYNFSIPSQLKGWIDRVVVAGRTFRYDANGVEGLVKGKKLFIASSRGGFSVTARWRSSIITRPTSGACSASLALPTSLSFAPKEST